MKKSIIMLLTIAMLVAVAASGCAPATSADDSLTDDVVTDKPGDDAVADVPVAEETAEPVEPVTIKFMHFWPVPDEIQAMVDSFEEQNPGITVEVENSAVATHYETLNARLATGEAPDVFTGWPGVSMVPYYQDGVCADLSGEAWVDTISSGAIRDASFDGKVQMLPVNVAVMGMAYNKAVFDELGLTPPSDYADFIAICEAVKAAGKTPIMSGTDYALYMTSIMGPSYVYSKNPTFDADVSSGADTIDNEKWTKIYKRICVDFVENGYVPKEVASIDRMTLGLAEFVAGSAAMMPIGAWDVATIREVGGEDFEFGMIPFPADNAEDTACLAANGEALAINADTEHMEAAKKLIAFLASEEGNKGICTAINSLSVVNGVEIPVDPALQEMGPYLSANPNYGFLNWPMTVQTKMWENCTEVIAGRMTLEDMMKAAQVEWMSTIE